MTSKLLGIHSEQLVVDIGQPDVSQIEPDLVIWSLSVSAQLPKCFPSLKQEVRSCFYSLPNIEPLQLLLDGDSSARFVLDVLNFKLEIYEHTLNSGPRHGYIVDCYIYSNNATQITDWKTGIGDQLLRDDWHGAVSTKFAFIVDHESLKSFQRGLAIDVRNCAHVGG